MAEKFLIRGAQMLRFTLVKGDEKRQDAASCGLSKTGALGERLFRETKLRMSSDRKTFSFSNIYDQISR